MPIVILKNAEQRGERSIPLTAFHHKAVFSDLKQGGNEKLCDHRQTKHNLSLIHISMEKVGLTEEIWNTPAELLSGGQRRRVALLRALLAPAQNILLDEPFTGLDDAALEQAMRFTKQQVQNRTLILATHNPVTAEFFGGPVLHPVSYTHLHQDYQVTMYGAADEVVPLLVKGDIDLAAIPANLAANLYNQTEGKVQVAAINTLGRFVCGDHRG